MGSLLHMRRGMKLVSTLIVLMTAVSAASIARAENVNSKHFEEAGFGDVGRLLESMTPEQRASILQQAAIKEKDLQNLTPKQLEQLKKQLRDIADTIDIEKIDPAKLDTGKAKPTNDIRRDMGTYQQKYSQGKINNSVVKPANVPTGPQVQTTQ